MLTRSNKRLPGSMQRHDRESTDRQGVAAQFPGFPAGLPKLAGTSPEGPGTPGWTSWSNTEEWQPHFWCIEAPDPAHP